MLSETFPSITRDSSLREIDWHFGRWIGRLSGDGSQSVILAAMLVSHRLGQGDVCVDLAGVAGQRLFADARQGGAAPAPDLSAWIEALRGSAAVGGPGEDARPLVLDGRRLYLARYFHFERTLAAAMHRLAGAPVQIDLQRLEERLGRLFPRPTGQDENDGQRIAAALAALRRLCIVSGGPGTGKTHTVAAILALLIDLAAPRRLRILLAAPTGKAAARLTEAIRKAKERLALPDTLRDAMPGEAMTLHRLLGVRPDRANPRHGPENRLHLDLLVVDEASMIDLPLMARVVAALPEHARLILLGDRDQLASVEAGNVFADLCAKKTEGYSPALCRQMERCTGCGLPAHAGASALDDCLVLLKQSYRFGPQSGIGTLARSVRRGADPMAAFGAGRHDIHHIDPACTGLEAVLAEAARGAFSAVLGSDGAAQALERLSQFAILCATHQGPAGVVHSNRVVEEGLRAAGRLSGQGPFYRGRPILITRNDYDTGLFNGDIGIVWPDPADGVLRAWFRQPDGSLKRLAPGRLPAHETAFAMTVHKCQGSEFDRVLLLFPDRDVRVLTRELLYTAITRARSRIEIRGGADLIRGAAARRADRASGLADRLWAT